MTNKRKTWDKEKMIQAVNLVRAVTAANKFGVPRRTLRDYLKTDLPPEKLVSTVLGRRPVFSADMEKLSSQYCVDMDNNFFGLRRSDVKSMAFQLAIKNNTFHPFQNEEAGRKWFKGFMRRNAHLSLRTPRATSHARVLGFSVENVNQFFNLYEIEFEKVKRQPHRIYNVDETGICVVQHKISKVLTLKGKK